MWLFLLGGAVTTGLVTQTALDAVAFRLRLPRPKAVLVWCVVLLLVVLAGLAIQQGAAAWRRFQPCGGAITVPTVAAPSTQPTVQSAAHVWVRTTQLPSECPRYQFEVSAIPDDTVSDALARGWPAPITGSGGTAIPLGPTPLAWFPDDFHKIDVMNSSQGNAVLRSAILSKRFYAASELVVALPRELAEKLEPEQPWRMRDLADQVARRQVTLVRADPRMSALGRLASAAMYRTSSPLDRQHQSSQIDLLENALAHTTDEARSGSGTTTEASGMGMDDSDVARLLCLGRSRSRAFVVSTQTLESVKDTPPDGVTGCPGGKDLTIMSLRTESNDELRLDRAVALLNLGMIANPAASTPVPSDAAVAAAKEFVAWLSTPAGQDALRAGPAGLTVLPAVKLRSVSPDQALDAEQAQRLADAQSRFTDSATRRETRNDLVVAVDSSGSMADTVTSPQGSSRYDLVTTSLPAVVARHRGINDRIGLVLFGGTSSSVALRPAQGSAAAAQIRILLGRRSPSATPRWPREYVPVSPLSARTAVSPALCWSSPTAED